MRQLLRTLALAFSLIIAWLVPTAQAQEVATTAAPAAPAAPPALARPALWKIADKDTTIYLFGTIHALPAGIDWLHGPLADALKGSDQLVTEIPATDGAVMQSAVLKSAMLPAGQTLRGLLSDGDRASFEKAVSGFGLPVEAFDRFEPWYAAVALTSLPLAKEGYSADNGVEARIATAAEQQGKPRKGLETAEYQLAMFDSLPLDVQKRYLHEVIDGLPTLETQLQDIIREWSAGNADKLAALLNEDEDDPLMVKVLLTDRNRAWAQWARQRMKRPGTVFVAVGAGHLAGKDSVLEMLEKGGIKAVRVQ